MTYMAWPMCSSPVTLGVVACGNHDENTTTSPGAAVMEISPWMLLFPVALLSLTLYCFNYIGDGLRDALDPKDR